MPSEHNPVHCLADIIESIADIESYTAGLSKEAFRVDRRTRHAVERCLQCVCEAGFRLGGSAAVLMPDQPWADIRGMGNRLRHAYDRIDVDIIWSTITTRLPSLKADAERALASLRAQRSPPS